VNSLANRLGLAVARPAVLALLGWYFIVPPLSTYLNNPKSFDTWKLREATIRHGSVRMLPHNGNRKCDTTGDANRTSEPARQGKGCVLFELWLEAYQCVETTDPRLLK
jgi:hypothetical protein